MLLGQLRELAFRLGALCLGFGQGLVLLGQRVAQACLCCLGGLLADTRSIGRRIVLSA